MRFHCILPFLYRVDLAVMVIKVWFTLSTASVLESHNLIDFCEPIFFSGVLLVCYYSLSWRLEFNPRSCHTKDSKMVLDAALLNTQHYKVRIKGKGEQLLKREPLNYPQLRSPTLLFTLLLCWGGNQHIQGSIKKIKVCKIIRGKKKWQK